MKQPLALTHPELAAQWHPTKNAAITAHDVVAGSNKKVWWQCPNGPDHEWLASPNQRTRTGSGCPCCAGRRVSVTNSLSSLFPNIAAEWHPSKNRDLTPDSVVAGSGLKVWWKCPNGADHDWQAI